MNNNNTFMQKYIKQAVSQLKLVHKDKTDSELTELVISKIESKSGRVEDFKKKYKVSEKDPFGVDLETNILDILNYLEDEKPVITGFGALYEQHTSGTKNILLEMVQMLLDIRKVYKKKKLAHANDEDKSLCNLYDKYQLTYKLLNNSFFGAAGQPQSIFFDPYFPSAIMYTGQIIIMTAIVTFEKLTGNFSFENIGDCLIYMDRIKSQEYSTDLILDINKSKHDLFELLESKFEGKPFNTEMLKSAIDNLTDVEVNRIYYKNNFLEFIENSEVKNLLEEIIKYEFLDPNEPSKDLEPYMTKFWEYTKEFCMYNYIPTNRTEFCHYHKRKTVLVVDTDSNFLYNKPFTDKVREFFPSEMSDYQVNTDKRVSCVNISMYIYTKLITEGYDHMGRMLNIDEVHRPVINMKNEFMYSRLVMTPAKKHYAGMLMAQEGIILTGSPEKRLDMKGLALRKSSLNKNIRDFFTETLINKILVPENINLADVYSDYEYMENSIKDSLLKGNLDFCQPGKVNVMDNYALPFSIQTVRGTLLWNSMFPDDPIMPPEKVNFVKLKNMSYTDFVKQLPEEYQASVIDMYNKSNKYNKDSTAKKLSDYDITILCLPKKTKEIPDFLITFIDIDTMVHDQIKAAMEIITPLGFKSLDILTKSFSTNIINV